MDTDPKSGMTDADSSPAVPAQHKASSTTGFPKRERKRFSATDQAAEFTSRLKSPPKDAEVSGQTEASVAKTDDKPGAQAPALDTVGPAPSTASDPVTADAQKESGLAPVPGDVFKAKVDKLTARNHSISEENNKLKAAVQEKELENSQWALHAKLSAERIDNLEKRLLQMGISSETIENEKYKLIDSARQQGADLQKSFAQKQAEARQSEATNAKAAELVTEAQAAAKKYWRTTHLEVLQWQEHNPGVNAETMAKYLHDKKEQEEAARKPVAPVALVSNPGQVTRNPEAPSRAAAVADPRKRVRRKYENDAAELVARVMKR